MKNPSKKLFRSCVEAGTPVVIEGAMHDWPALGKWTFEFLRRSHGSRPVKVEFYPDGQRDNLANIKYVQTRRLTLAEYLDLIKTDLGTKQYYLAEIPVADLFPDAEKDVRPPNVLGKSVDQKMVVFIGRNTFSQTHYHHRDQAILGQVTGRKRIVLYPPHQTPYLYPAGWFNPYSRFSSLPFERALDDSFWKFKKTQPVECTVEAGEMLFIPVHWWHTSYGLDNSISATIFWAASWRQLYLPQSSKGFTRTSLSDLVWGVRMCSRGAAGDLAERLNRLWARMRPG